MFLFAVVGFLSMHSLVGMALWIALIIMHVGTRWLAEMNANQVILRIGVVSVALHALCLWLWLIATRFEARIHPLVTSPLIYWGAGCLFVLVRLVKKSRLQRTGAIKAGCVLMAMLMLIWVAWRLVLHLGAVQ